VLGLAHEEIEPGKKDQACDDKVNFDHWRLLACRNSVIPALVVRL
jgi:hypothetical protein